MKTTLEPPTAIERNRTSSFADGMSIGRKLATMLAIPLLGLLAFAALQVTEKMSVVASMTRLEQQTEVAMRGSALLHELQRERGRSVRALVAGDRDSADLQAQRPRTDEAFNAFREIVAATELEGDMARAVESVQRTLGELAAQRSLVNSGSARPEDVTQYFSDAIETLLALYSTIIEASTSPSITVSLTSLDSLMRMKEMAGRERATVSMALRTDGGVQIDPGVLARQVGAQDAFSTAFLARAAPETGRVFQERMSASFAAEITTARREAFALATHRPVAAPTATAATNAAPAAAPTESTTSVEGWWRASTARMDAIRELEQSIAGGILAEVGTLKSEASTALWAYSLLALLCTAAAVFASWFLSKSMINSFTDASDALRQVVTQIAGFVRQQASATSETASAVSQTTTTVEELRKTAETANSRSLDMSETAKQSKTASDQALEAVTHGTEAMQAIRSEVEGIAENILELSEKNIQIGEIVQSVNAIAEQSNLLAVNASIEAAKAGEHGRGFSVVASEVKALAQQSKTATDQIRSLLGEIQKSSNGAVMITEQGVKRVEEGSGLIEELGRTIRSLGNTVEDSSDSAGQISLISTQQLAGIEQITEAMRNIGAATAQNAEGARQLEAAADRVRVVSQRILDIVQGRRSHGPAADGPTYA